MNQFREKSKDVWNEGEMLLSQNCANGSANRLYYSVFQAIFGFGLKENKLNLGQREKHGAALNLVKHSGPQSGYHACIFKKLRSLREMADYKIEAVDIAELTDLLPKAKETRDFFLKKSGE